MPKIKYTPRQLETNYNISKTSPLKSYLILSMGITAVILALYIILGFSVSLIAPHIPVSLEVKIGALFDSYGEETINKEETARVQELLDSMTPLLEEEDKQLVYRVTVTESPIVNAMAMPGGKIVVFSGLLETIENDQELAFVLGHELGHFHNRDHLKGMGRGLVGLSMAIVLLGADSGVTDFMFQRVQNLESKFSQSQEKDADMFGFELLQKKFGSAQGAVDFMNKLVKEEKHGKLAYYFATHPHPKNRAAYLQERLKMTN